jgi:hypothetical protein
VKFPDEHLKFLLHRRSIEVGFILELVIIIGTEVIGKEYSHVIKACHLESKKTNS